MIPPILSRIAFCALFFLSLALYIFAPGNYSPQHVHIVLILVFASLLLWGTTKQDIQVFEGRAFRPSIIFLIGYLIVHFQLYIDLILGNIHVGDYWLGPVSAINKSAALSFIGLIAFFLGSLTKVKPSNDIRRGPEHYTLSPSVAFCGAAFILFLGTVNWNFFQGGHIARMAGHDDAAMGLVGQYTNVLFQASLFVPLFFYMRNLISDHLFFKKPLPNNIWDFSKGLGFVYFGIFSLYAMLMLLSGRRSVPVSIILLYLFSYFATTKKRCSKLTLALAIFIGGILMFAVGVIRSEQFYQAPLSEKISAATEAVFQMFTGENGSFCPVTAELAGSVRSLHVTVDQVPSHYSHTYGRMALSIATTAIPFLNSQLLNHTLYSGIVPGSSASYATYIDQGDNITYGIGSTVILDFFFDGGFILVALGMFLIGVCFRKVEISLWTNTRSAPTWLLIGLVVFAYAFFSVRGTFIGIIKPLFYLWVLVLILKPFSVKR